MSDPKGKLKINEGSNNELNIDGSVFKYDRTTIARQHAKERVALLPRKSGEEGKSFTMAESEFDHGQGKQAHENLNTSYDKAKTGAISKTIHEAFGKGRVNPEKAEQESSAIRFGLGDNTTTQDISDFRESIDKKSLKQIPSSEFARRGPSIETYDSMLSEVHSSDRSDQVLVQQTLGMSRLQHKQYAKARNVNFTCFKQNRKLGYAVAQIPDISLNKEDLVVNVTQLLECNSGILQYCRGIKALNHQDDSVSQEITKVMGLTLDSQNELFQILKAKNVDVTKLNKYNADEFASYSEVKSTSEILPASDLDEKGKLLRADQTDQGRFEILPKNLGFLDLRNKK